MADEEFYKTITPEELKRMFKHSFNTKVKNKKLSTFFGNSVMGRILDLLLDNPKTAIFTSDLVEKSDVSRKSLYTNMLFLTTLNIVTEIEIGKKKCYILNTRNPITKHISKLRDMLNVEDVG